MEPDRRSRVAQLVHEALALDEQRRGEFLERQCARDKSLRAEVESLLAFEKDAEEFMEAPALQVAAEVLAKEQQAPDDRKESGQVPSIGPYQLLTKIGEGGMGQVWLAKQTAPVQRRVALKLIRWGMYDDALLHRFQKERQSLAVMDHPAIAKVFDAGATSEGQPYFVMEYVAGVPITDYCDQKRLKIRERLELFAKVCEGVQHAHQKAIIHRDLKPANILVVEVDGKPAPRIIDFGLAKSIGTEIAGESLHTHVGSFVGTPGYISPEQCDPAAQDVDTRTDVYSLGVVLYVLLAGSMPFERKERKDERFDDMLRQLREEDPLRPSTKVGTNRDTSTGTAEARGTEPKHLISALRGDLDCITMRALEKDRNRRYGTPAELAADLRRHLNHEPVMARPASPAYRLRKYTRRHRVGVAAATGLIILLAGFAVMQALQVRRITRERDRADRIAEFMTGIFQASDPNEKLGTITAQQLLDKAAKDIDTGLSQDAELQSRMMYVMGMAYLNSGLYSRAESLFDRSIRVASSSVGPKKRETLKAMQKLAWTLYEEGRFAEAEVQQRRLVDIELRVLGPEDSDTIGVMGDLATTLSDEGHLSEAEKLQREVLMQQKRLLGPEAHDTLVSMNNLAALLVHAGNFAEADKLERDAIQIKLRVAGPENLSTIHYMLTEATIQADMGQLDESERILRQLLEVEHRVLRPNQPEIAVTVYQLATVAAKRGQTEEALSLLQQAIGIGLLPLVAVQMEKDPDLNALHGNPRFVALVAQARERAAAQKGN